VRAERIDNSGDHEVAPITYEVFGAVQAQMAAHAHRPTMVLVGEPETCAPVELPGRGSSHPVILGDALAQTP
jgi:hypothetical protein